MSQKEKIFEFAKKYGNFQKNKIEQKKVIHLPDTTMTYEQLKEHLKKLYNIVIN